VDKPAKPELIRVQVSMVVEHEREEQLAVSREGVGSGWVILSLLAVIVAFTGGASRSDAIQIVALRSFSSLFLIIALFYIRKENLKGNRTLVFLFLCFVLIAAIQLVPLPSWLWQSLPGRGDIFRLDVAIGLDGVWRPLTLTPTRSLNVIGSLVVPASGLLLALAVKVSSLTLLRIIAVLGTFNAILGLLQIVSGNSSSLYLYEITNLGSPVGIFANENHAAIYAACSMLVVAALGLRVREGRSATWERLAYPAAFFLILLVSLVGGSRAGFAASIGVVGVSIAMLKMATRSSGRRTTRDPILRWIDGHPRFLLALPVLILSLTAVTFIALDRAPAFNHILSGDRFADLRWSLSPVILEMAEIHWLLGAGFGSFEQVYYIYEPSALLMPRYINQAHNDWVQLLIEGGLLAVFLLFGLIAWVAKSIVALSSHRSGGAKAIFWVSVFAILGLASLIDYPLRTPAFQLVAVWLLVALSRDVRDTKAT
jgi:heme/copper-type cytochrome/quinol oxidase subunit 4